IYSFGAMLSFTIAHLAVIVLRKRHPEVERGWKPPLNFTWRGTEYPLTAVLGGLGTLGAFVVVTALNPITLVVGGGWLVLGMSLYVVYRRSQHLPLAETVKVVLPEPLGVEEVEYDAILVAFDQETPFSEQTVATAAKLASRRRRGIHVISLVEIASSLPLEAPIPEQEAAAQAKIERAKLISGGMRVSGHVHRVRANQAGHAIVEEARSARATAIVMGLRYRGGAPLYTKALQTVLAERPCRVLVVGEPGAARAAAAEGGTHPEVVPV
ncbi:MAG: universal stress protein, partial [Solirubrobacterales bacterium]